MSELPEIGRPIARGASRCHILAVRDGVGIFVSACDIACGNFCGDESFESGMTECSVHHEPLCEECRDVVERVLDGGEWEGVESDPHHGVPRSVCQTHGCPELVFDGECWCWEHLTAGRSAGPWARPEPRRVPAAPSRPADRPSLPRSPDRSIGLDGSAGSTSPPATWGVDCPHSAHTCAAPVHFCDRHQEPGGTA